MIPLGEPLQDDELLAAARGERALVVSAVRAAGILGNRAGKATGFACNPFDEDAERDCHEEWQLSFDRARRRCTEQRAMPQQGERRSLPPEVRLPYADN